MADPNSEDHPYPLSPPQNQHDEEEEEEPLDYRRLLTAATRRRRTWAALFLAAYALLISLSWRLLQILASWYDSEASLPSPGPWPEIYASTLFGGLFGLLSMAAALAVALPAMVVTWISVLVLLACTGKSRRQLVREGRRATGDIAAVALKVLVREGKAVAFGCAAASFLALLWRRRQLAES